MHPFLAFFVGAGFSTARMASSNTVYAQEGGRACGLVNMRVSERAD
jgi:hypothetical protein